MRTFVAFKRVRTVEGSCIWAPYRRLPPGCIRRTTGSRPEEGARHLRECAAGATVRRRRGRAVKELMGDVLAFEEVSGVRGGVRAGARGCGGGQREPRFRAGRGLTALVGSCVEPGPARRPRVSRRLPGLPRMARRRRRHRGCELGLRSEQRVVRPLPVGRRVPGQVLARTRGRRCGAAVARRFRAPGRWRADQPAVGGGERQRTRRRACARNGPRDVPDGEQRAARDDRGSSRAGGARRDREGVRRPVRRSHAHGHLEPSPEAPGVQERTSVQHVLG